jgi:hypothetical protein
VKKQPKGRGGARAGAGRPASGRVQVTYWLDGETVDRLDRIVPERIDQARVIEAAVGRLTDKQIKEMTE